MGYVELYYDERIKPKTQYPQKLVDYLCGRFSLKGKVLDVGSGRGEFINAFKNKGCECFAIDSIDSHDNLDKKIVFKNANLEVDKLPFDDGSFDVVFTKSVLEHVYNYDNFISECKRVLKIGGTLIIMTPDWSTCYKIFYGDHTHVRPYIQHSLNKLLLSHSLSVVTCERFIQYPAVWKNPFLKAVCRVLQCILPPVNKIYNKSTFIRWSRELILLAAAKRE